MSESISYAALSYALAALGKSNNNQGDNSGNAISIKVVETITLPSGEKAKVVNLGNDNEVLLQFFIPQGLDGGQWHISGEIPGTSILGSKNGDLILYSTGDIYKIIEKSPVNQGINIIGKEGFSPAIVEKINSDDEYILTITDKNGSYDTPNLKGFGASWAKDVLIFDCGGAKDNI